MEVEMHIYDRQDIWVNGRPAILMACQCDSSDCHRPRVFDHATSKSIEYAENYLYMLERVIDQVPLSPKQADEMRQALIDCLGIAQDDFEALVHNEFPDLYEMAQQAKAVRVSIAVKKLGSPKVYLN